jgi:Carboxypeptidase regulatory-like domain
MKPYLLLALSLLLAFSAKSQQPLVGSIEGTVKDQRGAPLMEASLTATNIDAVNPESNRHITDSDKSGFFQLVDLPPGHFSILVHKSGYRDYTVSSVTVRPGETVKMPDIKMVRGGK